MKVLPVILAALTVWSCTGRDVLVAETESKVRTVSPANDSIRITGRVNRVADSVEVYWPGTKISFRFRGHKVSALLSDEAGNNYFNVVIDGDSVRFFKLKAGKGEYTLAEGLAPGVHQIDLIKRSEWDKGDTWFGGLQVDNVKLEPLTAPSKRIIEFFGNSITAGYAIEDNTGGDSPDSTFTNNYYTYAARTARHFSADYYCTVKSGIGITISWFDLIMPELYNRLDPSDSLSRWDFTQVQPQVVVINLLQNDSWLVNLPDHESFTRQFGKKKPGPDFIIKAYQEFVKSIRVVYPNAHIVCALGSMDATKEGSPWPGYVTKAVTNLHDSNVHTLFFPFTGKAGHPRVDDNEKMAKILIDYIERNVQW
jgi:hypothetical protein